MTNDSNDSMVIINESMMMIDIDDE